VIHMGERKCAYGILVGKPEGKRPLGKPKCRWEDDIKMDLKEVGWEGLHWIDLAKDRGRWWARECSNEPPGFIKYGNFLINRTPVRF